MEICFESPSSASGWPSRPVLVAEIDLKLLNSLSKTLKTTIPDLCVDCCPSRDYAVSKLACGPYHMIIANANFAVMDSCSLLKGYQSIRSRTPFVVTVGSSGYPIARRALREGAFDVLVHPIDDKQIVEVVRPALWLYQLRCAIHLEQERGREYQQLLAASNTISAAHKQALNQNYLNLEAAYLACHRSINQIEASLRRLENIASNIEANAHERSWRAFDLP